jgi:hypothetical protein
MGRQVWAVLATLAAVAGGLAGCTHIPVTSMLKLARVDVVATEPGQLRAAVKVPRAVIPQSMVMRIDMTLPSGERQVEDFRLREVSSPADVLELEPELDRNTRIVAYQVDPADLARLIAFREALNEKHKAQGARGGKLALAIVPQACRTAELPPGPVYFTSCLRTQETGGYVPLARDLDLRTVSPGRDLAAEIPPCP